MIPERLSIEVTNRCSKRCAFCYNHSHPAGDTLWTPDELVNFISDCAKSGTKAVSFGGGEPLEYAGLFEALAGLRGVLFRSITTNGLRLNADNLDKLVSASPDKVHLSIHFPDDLNEVNRVIRQVKQLEAFGIHSGVNLVVSQSNLAAATQAAATLRESGIGSDRIIYLPMRGSDTPTPQNIAIVAGDKLFQSMSCLTFCHKSPRFCAISWDKQVAWCSYTAARRPLAALTAKALAEALLDLPLSFCGNSHNFRKTTEIAK